jgi:hypothetical protein
MSLLDFDESYKPPFTKKVFEREVKDNFEELQNLGHKEVSEDYSDEIKRLSDN